MLARRRLAGGPLASADMRQEGFARAENHVRLIVAGEGEEIGVGLDRGFEKPVIVRLRHINGPEAAEMRRGELGVEQLKTSGVEPRHQMHQRDLARIARAREHRIPRKRPHPALRHRVRRSGRRSARPRLSDSSPAD